MRMTYSSTILVLFTNWNEHIHEMANIIPHIFLYTAVDIL